MLECGHVIVLLKGLLPLLKGAVGRRIIRIDEKSIRFRSKNFALSLTATMSSVVSTGTLATPFWRLLWILIHTPPEFDPFLFELKQRQFLKLISPLVS